MQRKLNKQMGFDCEEAGTPRELDEAVREQWDRRATPGATSDGRNPASPKSRNIPSLVYLSMNNSEGSVSMICRRLGELSRPHHIRPKSGKNQTLLVPSSKPL